MTAEHRIEIPGSYTRNVWLLEPPSAGCSSSHAVIFLDGEFYVKHMHTPGRLRQMQAQGELPAMPCLFVSHVDGAARHADLTCNEGYAAFIAHEVMGWLRARFSTLAEGGHLIAGPSLGGLAAAFVTLRHPQVFARCLSQSGSFWWENEQLTGMLAVLPPSRSRFWISVGDRETQARISHAPPGMWQAIPQTDACKRFAAALSARGHVVRHSVYAGAHEMNPWAEELPQALRWLWGPDPDAPRQISPPQNSAGG